MITPSDFGAFGDGIHDDSAALQAWLNAGVSYKQVLYLKSVPVYYLINTPLNLTNISQLLIRGDGAYPCSNRITPSGGSILAGNTGTGKPIIDATGASGLKLQDITLASIGLPNPSTIGTIHGTSSVVPNGGACCAYDDVSILLPQTGASIGVYGVSANLMASRGLRIMSDRCLYLSDINTLGVVPPCGTFGPNIQSDGAHFDALSCFGYGGVVPFVLNKVGSHTYDQLYICNINGGSNYTGEPYAMEINGATDVRIKVEIDYFPSAVHQLGTWRDVNLDGIIYQWTTPMPPYQPSIAGLNGDAIYGGRFAIRGISAVPEANASYGTASSSPTLGAIQGTEFVFDTSISPQVCFFDFGGSNLVPLFNVAFNGNTDGPPLVFQQNGVPLVQSQFRAWVNGIRTGTA